MKSKFFRVARSGKTVDGREITPAQIDQMAATYDPSVYGARIWCEHLRSLLPDGVFQAYGDVTAVKAETDDEGRRVLLAQIDATPDLLKLAADRQKVFWSVEIDPNFTGTGNAYLAGLAITDSPASTGTEMLKFSLSRGGDNAPRNLFSEPVEGARAIEEAAPEPDKGPSLFARVKELLAGKAHRDGEAFAELEKSTLAIAEEITALRAETDAKAGVDDVKSLRADLDALKASLENNPATPPRPKASGGGAPSNQTDC